MKKFKIGLQLYSVRTELEKDFEGTIKKVAEMGYDTVEFAGYYGKSAKEIKEILKKYSLDCVSCHQKYEAILENPEEMVDFQKEIGIKYSIIPWMAREKQADTKEFEKTKEEINKVIEYLGKKGIIMGYHNHDFEFDIYEGKFLLDHFYDTFPKEKMITEIDTCWCKYAGYDPSEYMKKYAGRMPVLHLKDFTCNKTVKEAMYALIDDSGKEIEKPTRDENGFKFKPLGEGMQDMKKIIETAEETGVEYLIVEQDGHPDYEPLESVRRSREYLKTLGL